MATSFGNPRPRHAGSPFQTQAEPVVEQFEVGDRVCHDSHGLGRVVSVDALGATVDFGAQLVRVVSPFRKMTKL